MQIGKPTSELIVLSGARDLAVRKLRGFAASIGASARLIASVADLTASGPLAPKAPTLVLWDVATVSLSPSDIHALGRAYFLVAVGEPTKLAAWTTTPEQERAAPNGQPAIRMTWSCKWPLSRLLDTQIARVVLGQAMIGHSFVNGFALLRWGHHSSAWPVTEPAGKDGAAVTLSGTAASFGKTISAHGDLKKKLVAIARLLDSPVNKSRVHPEAVVFASDGLLTCAIATCDAELKDKLDISPESLKMLGCQAVLQSEHKSHVWQIAFVFRHQTSLTAGETAGDLLLSSPMMITFPKQDDDSEAAAAPLVSAAS